MSYSDATAKMIQAKTEAVEACTNLLSAISADPQVYCTNQDEIHRFIRYLTHMKVKT